MAHGSRSDVASMLLPNFQVLTTQVLLRSQVQLRIIGWLMFYASMEIVG